MKWFQVFIMFVITCTKMQIALQGYFMDDKVK